MSNIAFPSVYNQFVIRQGTWILEGVKLHLKTVNNMWNSEKFILKTNNFHSSHACLVHHKKGERIRNER